MHLKNTALSKPYDIYYVSRFYGDNLLKQGGIQAKGLNDAVKVPAKSFSRE